jgi:hypothetical protein
MAFDVVRRRAVLFGGNNGSTFLNDTWEYDGITWIQANPSVSPPNRFEHTMVFDSARSRVVLFGGQGPGVGQHRNDTWEWDGTTWTQRMTPVSPTLRTFNGLAYDSGRDRVVMFGGYFAVGTAANDTWEHDGSTWVQRSPATVPVGRHRLAMEYDSARGRTIMYAGFHFGFATYADTWEWDGNDWMQRAPLTSPPAREVHALCYDPFLRRVLAFGGRGQGNVLLGDTWAYGPVHPANWTAFGAGCPGTAGTPALGPAPGSLPWTGGVSSWRSPARDPRASRCC